ncbi:flagellar protein FliT [Cytobacillus eiseniae]|uniref:Flagellar protein FliT n=1 Tax=Cytobacillus eiseniae TaxID=762947 RepID=A0ABS4RH05_9BACI|nr:hypothetical protein [Cytobacillus eiseniae]MBP2241999.1 flagellar protein FliT [Cytobacillus eiseniae]
MTDLHQFNVITLQLLELLTTSLEIDREENIIKINRLLDQREVLMESIHPPFSEEDMKIGQQLLQLNMQVNNLLVSKKQEIQRDMKELDAKKKSSNKYVNPYGNFSIDGMFYDKKN